MQVGEIFHPLARFELGGNDRGRRQHDVRNFAGTATAALVGPGQGGHLGRHRRRRRGRDGHIAGRHIHLFAHFAVHAAGIELVGDDAYIACGDRVGLAGKLDQLGSRGLLIEEIHLGRIGRQGVERAVGNQQIRAIGKAQQQIDVGDLHRFDVAANLLQMHGPIGGGAHGFDSDVLAGRRRVAAAGGLAHGGFGGHGTTPRRHSVGA